MKKVTLALVVLLAQAAPARATSVVYPEQWAEIHAGLPDRMREQYRQPRYSPPINIWTQDRRGAERWKRDKRRRDGWWAVVKDEVSNAGEHVGEGLWNGDRWTEFKQYGNWAGGGWWGGGTDPDTPGDHPPLDPMDEAAMRHDFTYQLAEEMERIYGANEKWRIQAIADQILVQDALALDPDPAKWVPPPRDIGRARRFRDRMVWFFTRARPAKEGWGIAEWAGGWIRHPIDSFNLAGTRMSEVQVIDEVRRRQREWFEAHPQHASAPGGSGVPGGSISGSLPGGPGVQPTPGTLPGGPAPGGTGSPGAGPGTPPATGGSPSPGAPGKAPEVEEKKPDEFFLGGGKP